MAEGGGSEFDLSAGESPPKSEADLSAELLKDSRYRRHYRTAATVLGIFVILALVVALGRIILALTSVPPGAVPQMAKAASAPASAASAAATLPSIASAVDTLLNPTGAVVGLVASLTIAITVLTIALVRSIFHSESQSGPDIAPALPSVEAMKSVGQILEVIGKALGGGRG